EVKADQSINTSVFYRANGGFGSPQLSVGGDGGKGGKVGGDGGSVGASGNGGDGGKITLQANKGPNIVIKEMTAYGGNGDLTGGHGGNGGDSLNGNGTAGKGGAVGSAGDGGKGGSATIEFINLAKNPVNVNVTGNRGFLFYGGLGGAHSAQGGNGGNSLADTV